MSVPQSSGKSKKKGLAFQGYFSLLLSLTIFAAALIWLVSSYAPAQDYLPVSFAIVVLLSVGAFVILNKRII